MMDSAFYSDIGGRSCNEDSVIIKSARNDKVLAVVADGLGGHGGGQIASAIATETVAGGWNGTSTPESLSELIQKAHRKILSGQTSGRKMKSTVAVLSLTGRHMDWAYVGDSRLYHFTDGKLVFQTRDHSASQIAVLMGQIAPEQIRFHEDRSRIFRALGQEGSLNVDAQSGSLSPGNHAFLLCSDGFWEYVYESEMEDTLAQSASVAEWLKKMRAILAARIPGDNDNNTAAAIWLTV